MLSPGQSPNNGIFQLSRNGMTVIDQCEIPQSHNHENVKGMFYDVRDERERVSHVRLVEDGGIKVCCW